MFTDNSRERRSLRRLGLLIGLVLALGGCAQIASQQGLAEPSTGDEF
jgi:hypothetical protein